MIWILRHGSLQLAQPLLWPCSLVAEKAECWCLSNLNPNFGNSQLWVGLTPSVLKTALIGRIGHCDAELFSMCFAFHELHYIMAKELSTLWATNTVSFDATPGSYSGSVEIVLLWNIQGYFSSTSTPRMNQFVGGFKILAHPIAAVSGKDRGTLPGRENQEGQGSRCLAASVLGNRWLVVWRFVYVPNWRWCFELTNFGRLKPKFWWRQWQHFKLTVHENA